MEHFKVFQEAQEAIRQVVRSFDFFRTDNFLVSNLLQNIESLLEEQPRQYNNSDSDNINKNMEPSNDFQVNSCSKKRKLHFGLDEHEAVDDDSGNLNTNAVNNSEPFEFSFSPLPGDTSPEDQVLAIELILEYIFSVLSTSDLKNCRYVNTPWNSSATKILNKRGELSIKFIYNTKSEAFERKDRRKSETNITLTEFSDFISKTYDYQNPSSIANPFVNFTFTSGNLNERSLTKFLQNSGYCIKQLEMELYSNTYHLYVHPHFDSTNQFEILRDFKKLITDYLPNVEILKLGKFPPLWFEEMDLGHLFPEPKSDKIKFLPKLKSLYFTSAPPVKIFKDLLRNSCNSSVTCASASNKLQSIGLVGRGVNNLNLILTALIEESKVHLVKCFEFHIKPRNLAVLEEFVIGQPRLQLTKLIVQIKSFSTDLEYRIHVNQVLTKILTACAETLKELHIPVLGDNFGLQIPVLREVKKIRTVNLKMIAKNHTLFPGGVKFSEVFPNVETIELTMGLPNYSHLQLEGVIGVWTCEELKRVKHVHFTYGLPAGWIEIFCAIWPNLKSFYVGITDDFPRACRAIWKLQNLESLGIIIHIKDEDETTSFPAIDESFTGFSRETCLTLFPNSREVDLESLRGLREHSSILDANSLRRLYLSFHESSEPNREGETFSVMSHVTGLFAFKMCPQLKITLSYSAVKPDDRNFKLLKNGLSSILPYVHEDREVEDPYDTYLAS